MGINGLLPFVEPASKKCNISEFKGCTVAVDSYCWLHKGATACAQKLVLGEKTSVHIFYCLKYVNMLLSNNIKPIMVFDGCHLPAKRDTEKKRRDNRKTARIKAAEFLRLGKTEDAWLNFRKAVDITHDMALELIVECRKLNVDCIVAPYEADAQLAFLSKQNLAQVIITEDSDLILFGCKKVMFKMDLTGNGTLVDAEKLYVPMKMNQSNYTFEKFQLMCILSGCDYLDSLPGIGLKKALKFFSTTADPDIYNCLRKVPIYLNMKQLIVSDEYRNNFMAALATFQHQIVFDPLTRKCVHLTSIESAGTDDKYCINTGEIIPQEKAFQLALGNIDPFSLKVVSNWNPDTAINQQSKENSTSIWSRNYKKRSEHSFQKKPSPIQYKSTKHNQVIVKTVNIDQLNNSDTIQQMQDYDDKLLGEINKLYKSPEITSPPNKKRKVIQDLDTIETVNDKSSEEDLSPVLAKKIFNPFIKIKSLPKISQFPRTVTPENKIVKSKYFNKPSAVDTDVKTFSNLSLLEAIDNSAKPVDLVESHSNIENCTPLESGNKNNNCKVNDSDESQYGPGPSKPPSPKKLFAPCQSKRGAKRPGLSRNSSKEKAIDKKQPSVLSMFQYVKK